MQQRRKHILLKLFLFLRCCVNTIVGIYDLFYHHLFHIRGLGFPLTSQLAGMFYLISAGSEPFVIRFLSNYCSIPRALSFGSVCGSGGDSAEVPLSLIQIPSHLHYEPCYQLSSPEADFEMECGVQGAFKDHHLQWKGAEAEQSRRTELCASLAKPQPAWKELLEGALPLLVSCTTQITGYPRKGVAGGWQLSAAEKDLIAGGRQSADQTSLSWIASGIWVAHLHVFHKQQSHFPLRARHNHPIYIVNLPFFVHSVVYGNLTFQSIKPEMRPLVEAFFSPWLKHSSPGSEAKHRTWKTDNENFASGALSIIVRGASSSPFVIWSIRLERRYCSFRKTY